VGNFLPNYNTVHAKISSLAGLSWLSTNDDAIHIPFQSIRIPDVHTKHIYKPVNQGWKY